MFRHVFPFPKRQQAVKRLASGTRYGRDEPAVIPRKPDSLLRLKRAYLLLTNRRSYLYQQISKIIFIRLICGISTYIRHKSETFLYATERRFSYSASDPP